MNRDFSRPPLSRPAEPSKEPARTTPAKRRLMRFVEAATPAPCPTRLPVTPEPQAPKIGPKELRAEIEKDFQAKHKRTPNMDELMAEVCKRLGLSTTDSRGRRKIKAGQVFPDYEGGESESRHVTGHRGYDKW